ncbi:MAG: GIY-YIG nuclease family protein [Aulosira sp. DedQUE10]|nr:GIY-YIG nuclease family protein [Aulosira sp. DedQUE10]
MLLENIKFAELPSVYLLDKDKLPNCAAIYFVSDSKGQILYIGRTVNLVGRWREHHRFKQLKRFNRKDRISISWINYSHDINALPTIENELINLYKPPLNWSKVVAPIRRITPAETALQQSLQQLAKCNTMIFGFDPIADEEPPTIYLVYPVYDRRGVSGSIRSALKNINRKASTFKWKEYHTDPKYLGKFGYWQTEYNGIRIDLAPFQGLVHFMDNSTRRTIAGVELMAFSSEQLEILLENTPEFKETASGLDALEDDPIPIELVDKKYKSNSNNQSVVEVEPWEELEPMAEGEARVMTRQFLYVDDVEIEVCANGNGKHFVRHNVYWWIERKQKIPDLQPDTIIKCLNQAVNILPTIKWSGYRFRFETIVFSEDDMEAESILLPFGMFEDLMKEKSRFSGEIEKFQSGEYKLTPEHQANIKLCIWLQSNSLSSLLSTNNS